MGIESYNTNPDLNTSQLGMATGNNALAIGNVDNAIRKLMADLAAWYATAQPLIAQISSKQGSSAILNALVGAGAASDRLPYYTGSDSAALATITSFARTLLDDADATAARTTLGAINATDVSLSNPGHLRITIPGVGPFQICWGYNNFSPGTTSVSYSLAFPTASFPVMSAAAIVTQNNNPGSSSSSTTGFTAYSSLTGSIGGWWIAAGY